MKAKSDHLAQARRAKAFVPPGEAVAKAVRMPREKRRADILARAGEYFAEYGLTAQTRGLADACGISQRLLYSFFPTKSALIQEVYRDCIEGPFKAVWLVQLRDRSQPMQARLSAFYLDYYEAILSRRWLRLFLYASLAEEAMAQKYMADLLSDMLEVIVREAAHEMGLAVPSSRARIQEIGWILHGAVSHLAIRRRIYRNANPVPVERVIPMHVQAFLVGLPALLEPVRR